MKVGLNLSLLLLLEASLLGNLSRAQDTSMPGMPMPRQEPAAHQEMNMEAAKPAYPKMRRTQQSSAGNLVTLEQMQKLAADKNPTLRQAESEIRATRARQKQAGLYPNPTVGYAGDEIRGGSVGGGKQGFFVQQSIVTGNKLGLSRDVSANDLKLAEIEAQEQTIRVQSAVKMAYLRVLAAQELLDTRNDIARIAADAVETQRRLSNTGQADQTEVLESEVEARRARMAARMQENTLREEWRSLAAVVGQPDLPLATVTGDLERNWPELNEEETVEAISRNSPANKIADAAEQRAFSALARAKREAIPDIQLRAGMEYNNDLLANSPQAKGWEGFAEASIEIPLFNRNQGNVAAGHADAERAGLEKTRIALTLRERAASVVDQYANARLMAVEYRDEILPRARQAYGLMFDRYGQLLASYPRVLEFQRKLYELQIEYISTLEGVWTNGIALQGFLLTDGLEAPARPGEMDRPIRETNVPMPERTMSPSDISSRRP